MKVFVYAVLMLQKQQMFPVLHIDLKRHFVLMKEEMRDILLRTANNGNSK